jgi:hypothetical protein
LVAQATILVDKIEPCYCTKFMPDKAKDVFLLSLKTTNYYSNRFCCL